MQNMEQLEGYKEIRRKLMAETPVEERLWGLAPEERLAGLAPEDLLPALPVELLRALSAEYLATFPPDVREKIKKRLSG